MGIAYGQEEKIVGIELKIQRRPPDAGFLRPAADSPLAKGGIGKDGLPPYVGAVPPVGVEACDWNQTWDKRQQKKKQNDT